MLCGDGSATPATGGRAGDAPPPGSAELLPEAYQACATARLRADNGPSRRRAWSQHGVELNSGVRQPAGGLGQAEASVRSGSILTAVSYCPMASNILPGICRSTFPKAARRRAFWDPDARRFPVQRRLREGGRESATKRFPDCCGRQGNPDRDAVPPDTPPLVR